MAGAGIRSLPGQKPMGNKALSAHVTERAWAKDAPAKAAMMAGLQNSLAKHLPAAGAGGEAAAKLVSAPNADRPLTAAEILRGHMDHVSAMGDRVRREPVNSRIVSDVIDRHYQARGRAGWPQEQNFRDDPTRQKLSAAHQRAQKVYDNKRTDANQAKMDAAEKRLDDHAEKLAHAFRAANPTATAKADSLSARSLAAAKRNEGSLRRRQRVERDRLDTSAAAAREAARPAREAAQKDAMDKHLIERAAMKADINKGRIAEAQPKFKAEFQRLAKQSNDTRAADAKTRATLGKTGPVTAADHALASHKEFIAAGKSALSAAPALPKGQAYVAQRGSSREGFSAHAVDISKEHGGLFSHKSTNGNGYSVAHRESGIGVVSNVSHAQASRIVKKAGGSTTLKRAIAGDNKALARIGKYKDAVIAAPVKTKAAGMSRRTSAAALAT